MSGKDTGSAAVLCDKYMVLSPHSEKHLFGIRSCA
jgi:hypothetical protein